MKDSNPVEAYIPVRWGGVGKGGGGAEAKQKYIWTQTGMI